MKLKLTSLQIHKLRESDRNAREVLNDIKQRPLKGSALRDMKLLEGAVTNIELVLIGQQS